MALMLRCFALFVLKSANSLGNNLHITISIRQILKNGSELKYRQRLTTYIQHFVFNDRRITILNLR